MWKSSLSRADRKHKFLALAIIVALVAGPTVVFATIWSSGTTTESLKSIGASRQPYSPQIEVISSIGENRLQSNSFTEPFLTIGENNSFVMTSNVTESFSSIDANSSTFYAFPANQTEALGQIGANFTTSITTQTTITVTITVIGWVAPDSAHLANTMILFIFPLVGMVGVTMIPMMFRRKGDVVIYFSLFGLFLGALTADLSTGQTPTNAVPFGMVVVAALLLFFWWWNS